MLKQQKARFAALSGINEQCLELLSQINAVLVRVSVGDPAWKRYIRYVEKNVLFELSKIVQGAVDWMIEQIDDQIESEHGALIEVQLGLFGGVIKFTSTKSTKSAQKSSEEQQLQAQGE